VVNRCRALENMACVVAANQGASLKHYAPFSWPGGSMVVDYDGRILAQADPGPGEKIVVAEVDVGALREARRCRLGHNPLAHFRREAYPAGAGPAYPAGTFTQAGSADGDRTVAENEALIRSVLEERPYRT